MPKSVYILEEIGFKKDNVIHPLAGTKEIEDAHAILSTVYGIDM